jgi:uncharacterized protein YecE (DUF72 family)
MTRAKPVGVEGTSIDAVAIMRRIGTPDVRIGTAGWCITRPMADRFGTSGTHLEKYAAVLNCAEINSSFHRPHARATYEKWAAATPAGFRFAVKIPRTITHDQKLRRCRAPLQRFVEESAGLGRKRGPLLVQLPPSLAFDRRVAARFFDLMRSLFDGLIVCEPRHPTWFAPAAESLLLRYSVARVAADPPPVPEAATPAGWLGISYYRLHGSPRKYWSRYSPDYLARLREQIRRGASPDVWCIFDNTASGAALENAWELQLSQVQ